ncbi:hypothetical protein VTJ83DRAFT_7529 [Remersonia thermophila]|uniref:Meiotic recombination protein DMC1 n=1 Tax=Remersonia thermophila TaxID=72144 RepID=A0ABR4D628_9PEZI
MVEATGSHAGGGGFLAPSLPSPAPTTSTVSTLRPDLPHPRRQPLRPGSAKEDQVRDFISDRMSHITRRFVKKTGGASLDGDPGDDIEGYGSMAELCKDLDEIVNIIWLSGTPSLQIPSLLNIASELNTWMPSFPPSPAATFGILHKLDHCFASLLAGEDAETREPLPGFDKGLRSGLSRTDMVRCKSTVQHTRVLVVDVMSKRESQEDGAEPTDQTGDEDDESGVEGPRRSGALGLDDDEDEELHMDVARVYEKTLVKLGETLGESGVGEMIQMSAD